MPVSSHSLADSHAPACDWIVCQLGAREHYAIARGLAGQGRLLQLVTDTWLPANSIIGRLPFANRMRGRHHPELSSGKVYSVTAQSIFHELKRRLLPTSRDAWHEVMESNEWFGHIAARQVCQLIQQLDQPPVVYSYSYTALHVFKAAKKAGCKCVLGQIDAGLAHERVLAEAYGENTAWKPGCGPPPEYWERWREECDLADTIIVNSVWSRNGLIAEGIPEQKLVVLPVAYQSDGAGKSAGSSEPSHNHDSSKLKLLVIGRATLEKGLGIVIEAAELLENESIEFNIVGDNSKVPLQFRERNNVFWRGNVPRDHVSHWYRASDILMFPTLSDGFGITQLEAQYYGKPVIASRNCGSVVIDDVNGRLLQENTPAELAQVLKACVNDRSIAERWAANSFVRDEFSIESVAQKLLELS